MGKYSAIALPLQLESFAGFDTVEILIGEVHESEGGGWKECRNDSCNREETHSER